MPINAEERIVELLEKNLIANLYLNGVTRDQIKEIVGVGSDKVSLIIKHLKKNKEPIK